MKNWKNQIRIQNSSQSKPLLNLLWILSNIYSEGDEHYCEDSEDEISDNEEVFKQYDIDGDDFITHDELKTFIMKRHDSVTDYEIEKMIKEVDIDGDGKISYEEYKTMMVQR